VVVAVVVAGEEPEVVVDHWLEPPGGPLPTPPPVDDRDGSNWVIDLRQQHTATHVDTTQRFYRTFLPIFSNI